MLFRSMWKEWKPDTLIVEKRAAGSPLIYELRKMGIPLSEYTPYKGQDKIARVNSISDLFASGVVWRPETRWAEEVMEEMAAFRTILAAEEGPEDKDLVLLLSQMEVPA